mgnify:CR=1 FL=1
MKRLLWVLISVGLMGGIFWLGRSFTGDKTSLDWKTPFLDNSQNIENTPLAEGQTVTDSGSQKKFNHSILGFSFLYNKDYSISSFGNYFDSNGQTILLQKDSIQGLQILITPFDEDISLTGSRIKKDLPSLVMQNIKEELIGETNVVIFESTNNLSTGKSLEGWFIYRKNLYQISSSLEASELFQGIINKWQWQ